MPERAPTSLSYSPLTRPDSGSTLIDDSGRRYSDDEVERLLARATELQLESGSAGQGLSLPTLAEIAEEIGVDPIFVEQAAAALDEPSAPAPIARTGPSRFHADLSSDHQLSREELLQVVDLIRRTTRHQGRVMEVLGTLEWKTSGQVNEIAVTALPVESGTRISVVADRSAAASMIWGFSVAGGLVAGAISGAILEPSTLIAGAGLLAAGGTAGLGLGKALWSWNTRLFRRRFRELTLALAAHLQESDDAP